MPKYSKNFQDASYWIKTNNKSAKGYKKITGSTTATCKFLAIVHEDNPDMTIAQLKRLLLDKTKFIYNPEAIAVLDAHIKAGYGDRVPQWVY